MSRSLEEIVRLAYARSAAQSEYNAALGVIDEGYEGKLKVDLPELRANERVAVANLLVQGVDQHGMRIASTMSDPEFPPLRNVGTSVDRAQRRRHAILGLWDENAYDVMMHRRARWLIAYARAPIQIVPRKLKPGDAAWSENNTWMVEWRLRSPHETFAGECSNPDDMTPPDCVFRYAQSMGWLERMYPDRVALVRSYRQPMTSRSDEDELVEIIEYVDGEETVLVATGSGERPQKVEASYGLATITHLGGLSAGNFWGVELDRYPNRTGICPVVIPGRITLGRTQGQFDQMVGMFEEQAHLMALELNAVRRAIFPDVYGVERGGEQLSIKAANGLTGKVGEIRGGDLKVVEIRPGFQTYPTIDRLTEGQRVQALIPPDFGGQSGSNIRTGRRGQEIVASTVDFSVQEAQLLFQRSQKHEITRAIETAKSYFGNRRKVYAVSWPGAKGVVDYKPNDIFEAGATFTVEYSQVGTDANMLGVNIAQAQGSDIISEDTARRLHPLVDDRAFEARQVTIEALRRALIGGLEQQMAAGSFPLPDGSRLIKLLADGTTVEDAMDEVHKIMQERQASSGAAGTPTGVVEPGSPEAQAGAAAGTPAAVAASAASIPDSTPSRDHLNELLHQVSTVRRSETAA